MSSGKWRPSCLGLNVLTETGLSSAVTKNWLSGCNLESLASLLLLIWTSYNGLICNKSKNQFVDTL